MIDCFRKIGHVSNESHTEVKYHLKPPPFPHPRDKTFLLDSNFNSELFSTCPKICSTSVMQFKKKRAKGASGLSEVNWSVWKCLPVSEEIDLNGSIKARGAFPLEVHFTLNPSLSCSASPPLALFISSPLPPLNPSPFLFLSFSNSPFFLCFSASLLLFLVFW